MKRLVFSKQTQKYKRKGYEVFSHSFFSLLLCCLFVCFLTAWSSLGQDVKEECPPAEWNPVKNPVLTGEVPVAIVLVEFKDTEFRSDPYGIKKNLDDMNGLSQEAYFKIYTNGIAWPLLNMYPKTNARKVYKDDQLFGYYCYYNKWNNPVGWTNTEEGGKRVALLKEKALKFAKKQAGSINEKVIALCYCDQVIEDPAKRPNINAYYLHVAVDAKKVQEKEEENSKRFSKSKNTRFTAPSPKSTDERVKSSKKESLPETLVYEDEPFDPWEYYRPDIRWAEPMWPNSSIQILSGSGAGTFAHEFGHVLGAADVYRISRSNDGISGISALLCYGPTASAYSRYYEHGYIKEKNYPTITKSGTYILHPRHINPTKDEAIGFIIPTRHPHYFYHLEYICGENPILGASGSVEGMDKHSKGQVFTQEGTEGLLISVMRPGLTSYKGSPEKFYTYRENDPFFRGLGDYKKCLFGVKHGKTEFNMQTEPSSRLPNLLDGGVKISQIREEQETLTFQVEMDDKRLSSNEYKLSLLPQIKLNGIDQTLPHSFRMIGEHKFRGEPLFQSYGFCWSTAPKPTIRENCLTLRHGEIFEGRAIDLKPNTQYYVRAWIQNSLGLRYSDEELSVTTSAPQTIPDEVSPLTLDQYANNAMLYRYFYRDGSSRSDNPKKRRANRSLEERVKLSQTKYYVGYSPISTLAKLMTYYKPEKVPVLMSESSEKQARKFEVMDYGYLHWEPRISDPGNRTSPTLAFFKTVSMISKSMGIDRISFSGDWDKKFVKMLSKDLKIKELPVVMEMKEETMAQVFDRIKKELAASRPVIMVQGFPVYDGFLSIWSIVDGYKNGGAEIHVQYPSDSARQIGYYNAQTLLDKTSFGYIITGVVPEGVQLRK